MNTYLLAIGWWNLIGSLLMLGFVYEPLGQKVLNDWTMIFKDKFVLDFWGKLWCFWAAGMNIFFALVNILSVHWDYGHMKVFSIGYDVCAYTVFVALVVWGMRVGRLGQGAYVALPLFGGWIIWGLLALALA